MTYEIKTFLIVAAILIISCLISTSCERVYVSLPKEICDNDIKFAGYVQKQNLDWNQVLICNSKEKR